MLFADPALNSIASLVLILVGIGIVLFVMMMIGKLLLKLIVGLVLNTVLGFAALFLIGWAFGISVRYTVPVIVSVVIFGLPAAGTVLLLTIFGGGSV